MTERIKKALAILSEEFDSIAIIATSHDFEANETVRCTFTHGNKYAIEYALREVVEDMDIGMHDFIMGGDTWDEDNG